VRAITRVATPESEQRLLDVALCGTASQVERLVRAWRRVDRMAEAAEAARRHQRRELHTWVDDDGMVVIRGRLTPEVGAVVQQALAAASDRLFREAAQTARPTDVTEETTPAQRRADALGLVAESALAADLDPGTAGDRYQVVLHIEGTAQTGAAGAQAVLEDGGTRVSAETSQRLGCDAAVVVMTHGADGSVLDVGRKTRTIPPAIRRALAARDRQCRFPGCTARRGDAHHVEHWADGGATWLDNLVLLCRRHHRLVHEGGWTIRKGADGEIVVLRPRRVADTTRPTSPGGGNVCLRPAPSAAKWRADEAPLAPLITRLAGNGVLIGSDTAPVWDGTPLRLG
jgi:hypothetical protein